MDTVISNKEFKIYYNRFNGLYMVINSVNDCIFYCHSKTKAINFYNKVSLQAGI